MSVKACPKTIAGLGLLLLAGQLACDSRPAPPGEPRLQQPRLVLLYVPCTVSTRFLSPYSARIPFTPELAAFAQEAVVFTRHQTEAGLSGVAFASILTGLHAPGHGIHTQPRRLDDDLVTLPEIFVEGGYETFFWNGHIMADAEMGYGQGVPKENVFTGRKLSRDNPDFQRILDRLVEDPDYRAFVMAFFAVSHAPYETRRLESFCRNHPARCTPLEGETRAESDRFLQLHASQYTSLAYNYADTIESMGLSEDEERRQAAVIQRLYESRIAILDRLFGKVVRSIRDVGMLDESLIVFSADHGEVLYRDNAPFQWSHGHGLAPEVLHVPLLIRAPGLAASRFEGVTRSVDLLPTIASLAGLSLPEDLRLRGEDLTPELRGAEAKERTAFSHSAPLHTWSNREKRTWTLIRRLYPDENPEWIWVSARRADLVVKWINSGGGRFVFRAHDLAADPEERVDLFSPDDARHRALRQQLEEYKAELVAHYVPSEQEARRGGVSEDRQRDLLKALGYFVD